MIRRFYKRLVSNVVLINNTTERNRHSIFDSLPSLHGTMLGIFLAIYGIYALFAYQKIHTQVDKLANYKYNVSQVISPSSMRNINDTAFMDSTGMIDLPIVRSRMWEIAGVPRYIESSRDIPKSWLGFELDQYIDSSSYDLLGLIELVARSFPYHGGKNLDSILMEKWELESTWIDELNRFNTYFYIYWNQNQKSLKELMVHYSDIDIQRQIRLKEETLGRVMESRAKEGFPMTDEEINRSLNFTPIFAYDYYQELETFFSKVDYIQHNLIPDIFECRTFLNLYKGEFKLKSRTILVLIVAVFVFLCGIILPLIMTAYFWKNFKYRRFFEIFIFVSTILPYLLGLLFLINLVVGLKVP